MCGIGGIINSAASRDKIEKALLAIQRQMHHRGPDDQGIYLSADGIAGLVSTRLAILDLSAAGHQPMTTDDGRYTITFNGEIYNFASLREALRAEGEEFKSHSDTEVILKSYARYGSQCINRFEGMFSFAIWDEQEQTCFLARGPLGIKPVYYFERNGSLIFGSELRTVLATGMVPLKSCGEAIAGYLFFGAVPEPLTLVHGVKALPAGHYLFWKNGQFEVRKYWQVQFGYDPSISDPAQVVRNGLAESVDRHLVSDVPVGIFLSGGFDSTALVALASERIRENLRTFCISFENPQFNEGDIAARTAKHFGASHSDWRLDSATAKGLLNEFLERSDQPSIDGFNTFCVSKLAHDQGFKVVLSGLGGDELFGGYRSFQLVPSMIAMSRCLGILPPERRLIGRVLEWVGSPRTKRLGSYFRGPPSVASAYWTMRGIFTPAEVQQLLPRYGFSQANARFEIDSYVPSQPDVEDEVSYLELTRYMRNQLLRDSDVMSMAWNLELRVPFVDAKFIDSISRIPAKERLARGKKLLLDAVPEIPEWVRNRPKQGFAFPFRDWITGEWNDVFRRIEASSPVPLKNWYRCWCLFALESFLARNGIERLQLAA